MKINPEILNIQVAPNASTIMPDRKLEISTTIKVHIVRNPNTLPIYFSEGSVAIFDIISIAVTVLENAASPHIDELIEAAILVTPIVSLEAINHGLNSKTYEARYKADNALELVKSFRDRGKSCRINTVCYGQTREELEILVDFCGENQVEKFSLALYNGSGSHDNLIAETNEMGEILIKHAQVHGYKSSNIAVEGV